MSFNIGNVIKYLWRADYKNGVEDLEKASWYLNREIERRKKLPKMENFFGDQLVWHNRSDVSSVNFTDLHTGTVSKE